MKLKFVSFCSSFDSRLDGIIFFPYQNVEFLAKNHVQAFLPKSRPFFVVFLLLAGRCYEVEFVPVCSSLDALSDGIFFCQSQSF